MTTCKGRQEQLEPRVGPAPEGEPHFRPCDHPAAGRGAAKSVSKVPGSRTCRTGHRPEPVFWDRLSQVCTIGPPRPHGWDTVGTIHAMHRGEVKAFVGTGGNVALAAAGTSYIYEALGKQDLTVQVCTKANRGHLLHGRQALILPPPGRPAA